MNHAGESRRVQTRERQGNKLPKAKGGCSLAGAMEMYRKTREGKLRAEKLGRRADLVIRSKERGQEPHPVNCEVVL